MVDRPSRFDKLVEFNNPNEDERRQLVTHFMSRPSTKEEVDLTIDMSVAAIKEVCILMRLRNLSIKDATDILKDRASRTRKFAKASKEIRFYNKHNNNQIEAFA